MSNWTLQALYAKAAREGVSLAELGRRGGRKATRLRAERKQNKQLDFSFNLSKENL